MWVKDKGNLGGKSDSKIVKNDYIIADGTTIENFGFCENENNQIKRDIYLPIFYLFKVHQNHPLRVISTSQSSFNINPSKKKDNKRWPAVICRDKKAYDLTTFLLLPFEVDDTKKNKYWKTISKIENGFEKKNGSKFNATLMYLDHGLYLHSQDNLKNSIVMPSQVLYHLCDWLSTDKKIYSHEKNCGKTLEGRTSIDVYTSRKLAYEVTKIILEKRYKTRLVIKR